MVGVGQGPGRDAGAAVVAAPAGIEVIAVAGDTVDRTVGRGADSHADRGGRIGVVPGRDHAAGGDVDAVAGDDRVGGHSAAAHKRERQRRSEEHTSEPPSIMRSSYAVFNMKKKTNNQ